QRLKLVRQYPQARQPNLVELIQSRQKVLPVSSLTPFEGVHTFLLKTFFPFLLNRRFGVDSIEQVLDAVHDNSFLSPHATSSAHPTPAVSRTACGGTFARGWLRRRSSA